MVKLIKIYFSAIIILSLFAPAAARQTTADLVIINANIRTMDEARPRAEALAVIKNKISAVGTNQEIRRLIGERTKTIDAQNRLVLPGFNDSHVHFMGMGRQFFSIDLREARSPGEIVERIRFYLQFLPKGQWILGGGWNHEKWTSADLPTKELIDEATPANPVFIYHSNTKMVLVNSAALKLAGIDKNTRNPPGGVIVRNASGEPTGILQETAINLVKKFVPAQIGSDPLTVAETASNYAARFGVTSVQDMSADDNTEIYRQLEKEGTLKTRIYDCSMLFDWRKTAPKVVPETAEMMVRGGCLKGFYEGETELIPELYDEILAADQAGRQVMIHAIGGTANEVVLTIFERVCRLNGTRDRRFRIEHAHQIRPADIKRFRNSGIIASLQPFLFSNRQGQSTEPFQTLLVNKIILTFGSDSSMIPVNPLLGIAAAVETSVPGQKLSVAEAVRFYTMGAAFAEFQETSKGSLAIGKLADLVILSDDIFTADPKIIRQTRVLKTIVDGRIVFEGN